MPRSYGLAIPCSGGQRQPPRTLLEAELGEQRSQRRAHHRFPVDSLEAEALDPPAAHMRDERGQGGLHPSVTAIDERLQRLATPLEVDDGFATAQDPVRAGSPRRPAHTLGPRL